MAIPDLVQTLTVQKRKGHKQKNLPMGEQLVERVDAEPTALKPLELVRKHLGAVFALFSLDFLEPSSL